MEDFLCHIILSINVATGEQLVVGLWGMGNGQAYFSYSEKKAKWAMRAFDKQWQQLVLHELQTLKKRLTAPQPFDIPSLSSKQLTSLAGYSQSIIKFSSPMPVAGLDRKFFELLYAKAVGANFMDNPQIREGRKNLVYQSLSSLKGRADLNYTVTPAKVPVIVGDIQVDLICKNGAIRVLKTLNPSFKKETLQHHINEYNTLYMGLSQLSERLHIEKEPVLQLYIPYEQDAVDQEKKILFERLKQDGQKVSLLSTQYDLCKEVESLDKTELEPFSKLLACDA